MGDALLRDELLALAAAAGVSPRVSAGGVEALAAWGRAPLVLVGAESAHDLAALRPPRRRGVHVVTWPAPPDDLYRAAVRLGADDVLPLPGATEVVVELLGGLDEARQRGRVVGVLGGSGGAGATTLACALGQVAALEGPAVVVDADPWGPGADRVLGLEATDGVRWEALLDTAGRLGARALRESLPQRGDLGVLAWGGPPVALPASAARETLAAASRGHRTVVLDLPRRFGADVDELVARCDLVVVPVAPTLGGLASAARTVAGLGDRTTVGLLLRGRGPGAEATAAAVGAPVLAELPDQRRVAEAARLGVGPVRPRGALLHAALTVLAILADVARADDRSTERGRGAA